MEGYIVGGPGIIHVWSLNAGLTAAVALVKGFKLTNQTDLSPDASRIWTITPENEEDSSELQAFLDAANPPGAGGSVIESERTRESGTKVGGGASGGTKYVVGVAGNVEANGAGANRKLWLGTCTVDPSSGGYLQKAGDSTKPKVILKSFNHSLAVTVSAALIKAIKAEDNTTFLYDQGAGTVDIVHGANVGGKPYFTPKAA